MSDVSKRRTRFTTQGGRGPFHDPLAKVALRKISNRVIQYKGAVPFVFQLGGLDKAKVSNQPTYLVTGKKTWRVRNIRGVLLVIGDLTRNRNDRLWEFLPEFADGPHTHVLGGR